VVFDEELVAIEVEAPLPADECEPCAELEQRTVGDARSARGGRRLTIDRRRPDRAAAQRATES